jgi:exonuclease SbcC
VIPIKLSLRNFMCYRDNVSPLLFDGIHTACISGDNGSGKSALIDAMTWALWGRTRAKSDDDLVYSDQAEMEVEFDFTVGEQPYRIIRKHSRPRRRGRSGQSSLDLLIGSDDSFKVISGDRITQTQQKIFDILHMDYDTFTNSALLRQGHADEFTIKRPVERKEVLAYILGLSFYDELEGQARELAKLQDTEKTQLESAIKEISDELDRKPAYQTELEQSEAELSHIAKATKEQEVELNRLRQKKESLDNKQEQLNQIEEHITATRRELERRDHEVKQLHSRIKEYEEVIAQRTSIEDGYAQLTEARRQNDELNQKLELLVKLRESKNQLEKSIEQAQAALITEHKLAQTRITELEAKAQRLPQLRSELQQISAQLLKLAEQEKTLNQKRQNCQELQAQIRYLESSQTQLEQEIKEIEEKLDLLLAQRGAKCPLCETEVGTEGLKLIETKYTADKEKRSDAIKSNQVEIAQKKTELESLANEISRLETRLNQDKTSTQSKTGSLNQQITEAEEADNRLNEARKGLTEIEERMARKDFATTEQLALRDIEDELVRLDYDSQQYDEVRQRRRTLEQYEEPKRKLEEADRLINQEKESASRAEEAAQELRHRLEVDEPKKQSLSQELNLLPQLVSDLTRAETKNQELTAKQRQSQEIMWSIKTNLQRCSEKEIKKQEKEKLLVKASKEEKIYKDLAQAFGKKGIQALLIEITLPEIEVEANKLLGRMTDNRMHLKIETQRETKKGDLLETLDINISDELGMRNYEMFSGGEAFRINFAIRIALSRLLARRAGAPLPTLIIDEGFGTQDSIGVEKLKEAINSIQDDFDKILVITHIEELRDAFPTHIDIVKTANGSTIEVS